MERVKEVSRIGYKHAAIYWRPDGCSLGHNNAEDVPSVVQQDIIHQNAHDLCKRMPSMRKTLHGMQKLNGTTRQSPVETSTYNVGGRFNSSMQM